MSDLAKNEKENKNFIGKIKASFSGRKFRSGAYATLLSAIVIVIVLVINMIATKADVKIDISTQKMFTLTEDTVQMVKELKDDVTIYYLQKSSNAESQIYKIAQKYGSISDHVKVVQKNTVLYPKFASDLGIEEEVNADSIIVVNNKTKRAKYIDASSMVITETDYSTYQQNTTGLDVEGKVTSAIQYVTSTDLPVMYMMEGHGEAQTDEAFKAIVDKLNVSMETLNIISKGSIPEDCDILFVNAPKNDFTEEEVKLVKDYMAAGGNVIITTNIENEDCKNFKSLLAYYGMEVSEGIVFEGDNNMRTAEAPFSLLPEVLSHDITEKVKNDNTYVVSIGASGLKVLDNLRSSLKVEPLLKTSDSSYSKIDYKSPKTLSKEKGDIEGPFYVGLLASETYKGATSKMAVYSTEYMFSEQSYPLLTQYGNGKILSSTISFMSGDSKTKALSIPTKSLQAQPLAIDNLQNVIFWGAMVVLVIPIFVLAIGIVISFKRRRK